MHNKVASDEAWISVVITGVKEAVASKQPGTIHALKALNTRPETFDEETIMKLIDRVKKEGIQERRAITELILGLREWWTSENFDQLINNLENFEDKEVQIQFAYLILDVWPEKIPDVIRHFRLPESDKFEIAKRLAKHSSRMIAESIDSFRLTPAQKVRVALAANPRGMKLYLDQFDLKPDDVPLATDEAECFISDLFRKLSPSKGKELAAKFREIFGENLYAKTTLNLKDDQKTMIIRWLSESDSNQTAIRWISNFKLKAGDFFNLLCTAAPFYPSEINFLLQSSSNNLPEQQIFEFLCLLAKTGGLNNIVFTKILKNKQHIKELGLRLLELDTGIYILINNLEFFNLDDQAKIKLAIKYANRFGGDFINLDLSLEHQEELSVRMAHECPEYFLKYIDKLPIKDARVRSELLRKFAKSSVPLCIGLITLYSFPEQERSDAFITCFLRSSKSFHDASSFGIANPRAIEFQYSQSGRRCTVQEYLGSPSIRWRNDEEQRLSERKDTLAMAAFHKKYSVLDAIEDVRSPSLRDTLMRHVNHSHLFPIVDAMQKEIGEIGKSGRPSEKVVKQIFLPNLLLLLFMDDQASYEEIKGFQKFLLAHRSSLKDGPKMKSLLDSLTAIERLYSPEARNAILKKWMALAKDQGVAKLLEEGKYIEGLVRLYEIDKIPSCKDKTLKYLLMNKWLSLVNLGPNSDALFQKLLTLDDMTVRSVLIYTAGLSSLKEPLRSRALDAFSQFLQTALVGKEAFVKARYEERGDFQFSKMFALIARNPAWMKETSVPLVLKGQSLFLSQEDILKRLKLALDNGHIKKGQYPHFEEAFYDPKRAESILRSGKKFDPIELLLLELLTFKNTEEVIRKLNREVKDPAFHHDIEFLLAQFTQKKSFEGCTIGLTDNPWDLFFCGTKILGSCQHVSEQSPLLNVGLTGYMMNGSNRLLMIKDAKGEPVARCLLKLCYERRGSVDVPYLLMENVYTNTVDKRLDEALAHAALQFANELKLPLVVSGFDFELHCDGGKAPEYSDASHGVQEGPYKFQTSLYQPGGS